jgi:hypothetical protein
MMEALSSSVSTRLQGGTSQKTATFKLPFLLEEKFFVKDLVKVWRNIFLRLLYVHIRENSKRKNILGKRITQVDIWYVCIMMAIYRPKTAQTYISIKMIRRIWPNSVSICFLLISNVFSNKIWSIIVCVYVTQFFKLTDRIRRHLQNRKSTVMDTSVF